MLVRLVVRNNKTDGRVNASHCTLSYDAISAVTVSTRGGGPIDERKRAFRLLPPCSSPQTSRKRSGQFPNVFPRQFTPRSCACFPLSAFTTYVSTFAVSIADFVHQSSDARRSADPFITAAIRYCRAVRYNRRTARIRFSVHANRLRSSWRTNATNVSEIENPDRVDDGGFGFNRPRSSPYNRLSFIRPDNSRKTTVARTTFRKH